MSTPVAVVVQHCEGMAREFHSGHGVTSTVLLRAIIMAGKQDESLQSDSAIARFASLVSRLEQFPVVMDEYLEARVQARVQAREKIASLPKDLKASANVAAIFKMAADLSAAENGRQESMVEGRHLMAAFLDIPEKNHPVGAWKFLEKLGLNRVIIRDDLFSGLAEAPGLSAKSRAFWKGKLSVSSSKEEPIADTRFLPPFNADDLSGTDRLGFGADIEAMAALMASKSVEPPLSIGIFGDWGSGKSFFVRKLSMRVRNLGREDSQLFWKNIEVIEFNAWHYVDSNLWASLVAHVFDTLRVSGKKQTGGNLLEEQLANLAVAQAVHAEAKLNVIAAEERLTAAKKTEGEIKQTLATKREALAVNVAKDLWRELQDRFGSNDKVTAAVTQFQEIKLAGSELGSDLRAIYTRAQEVTTTAGRMKLIGLNLLRGESYGTIVGGFSLATVCAVVLGVLLYKYVTTENIAAVSAALTQMGGTALAAIWWIRGNTQKVMSALEPVEKARTFIEGHLRDAEKAQVEATTRLEAEIEQELVAFRQASQEETEARRRLDEAKQAVKQEISGELIRRFVEERAGSGDYEKHLGLIAMIRDDFQRLSSMLSSHNANRESVAARDIPDEGINRIVLVIDDLDRCPPARVVEVLEAVFLLLAFPAFVVVVAVDSRWVSHSLLHKYEHLLQDSSDRTNVGQGKASPRDYLEKIFQIPYRVRRMNAGGYEQMIDALTGSETPKLTTGELTPDQLPSPQPGIPKSGDNKTDKLADTTTATLGTSGQAGKIVRPTRQAMRLTLSEVRAMKQLSFIVGRSPRATKRFVNIYRLLKAALPPEELLRFEEEEFRAAMLLLAVAHSARGISTVSDEADLSRTIDAMPSDLRSDWESSVVHFATWSDRIRQFSFEY